MNPHPRRQKACCALNRSLVAHSRSRSRIRMCTVACACRLTGTLLYNLASPNPILTCPLLPHLAQLWATLLRAWHASLATCCHEAMSDPCSLHFRINVPTPGAHKPCAGDEAWHALSCVSQTCQASGVECNLLHGMVGAGTTIIRMVVPRGASRARTSRARTSSGLTRAR